MKNLGILLSGRGSNFEAIARNIAAEKIRDARIAIVVSNRGDAPGIETAKELGLPTLVIPSKGKQREEHDQEVVAALELHKVDFVCLAGYMRLLSPEFVGRWEGRMLNIHPSLLPKYKGLDTHQRAIEAGDRVAGCSVHIVTAELDDGPVLGQTEVAVLPDDSADTLAARILIAEHQLYPRVLAEFVTAETRPSGLLARLRSLALQLPESYEKASHGTQAFGVEAGKMFAYFQHNHHGDGITAALVRTSGEEEQAMLIESDPDLYYRPAYLGPAGWIGIRLDRPPVDWTHIEQWLAKSWRRAAPKRLTKLMDVADGF